MAQAEHVFVCHGVDDVQLGRASWAAAPRKHMRINSAHTFSSAHAHMHVDARTCTWTHMHKHTLSQDAHVHTHLCLCQVVHVVQRMLHVLRDDAARPVTRSSHLGVAAHVDEHLVLAVHVLRLDHKPGEQGSR